MAKIRKLPKIYQEEYQDDNEKLSINRMKEGEEEGPMSVNRALELEQEEKVTVNKGIKAPVPEAGRDPSLDEAPIEEDDLGLPEGSFLIDRKVNHRDLYVQMNAQEKQFLGSNVRKPRDFASIFDKGKSSESDPKLDLAYEIHHNPEFKKRLIAQQLLRNYNSVDSNEVLNAELVFKELKLMENEDFVDGIHVDLFAHENDDLIAMLQKILPNL